LRKRDTCFPHTYFLKGCARCAKQRERERERTATIMDETVGAKTTTSLVDTDDEDDDLFFEKEEDAMLFSVFEGEDAEEILKGRRQNSKDKVNVVVRCKIYQCDGICGNKYQIRSKTCRACLNAKEVYVKRGDETPSRFCQKCTKFHATDMFEGGRKACKMSLKKVQEKNRVIFARQRMMTLAKQQQQEDEENGDAHAAKKKSGADKTSTLGAKKKKERKSRIEHSSKEPGTDERESDDAKRDNNNNNNNNNNKFNEIRKRKLLQPHSMDSLHSLIEEEREKMKATAAAVPMKMAATTTTTTSGALPPAVDRVDRLVEAIKSKKRKESLLDLPFINGNASHTTEMLKLAEEEEEEEREGKDDDLPTEEEEEEEEEEDDGDGARIKNSSNDDKSGSKPPMKKLISMVQNAARSVTPSLYREAMQIKLKEFFGLPSSSSPSPSPPSKQMNLF
jgi:hypothetical protein